MLSYSDWYRFKDIRSLKIHLEKAGIDKCPICNAEIRGRTRGRLCKHLIMKKDEEHQKLAELICRKL